jgi:hypothetical protein
VVAPFVVIELIVGFIVINCILVFVGFIINAILIIIINDFSS